MIADELDRMSEDLIAAGEELSEDGEVLARHQRLIQGFDQWVQIQRGLAQLLRAEDINRAVASCRPGDLAERLNSGATPSPRADRRPRSSRTR